MSLDTPVRSTMNGSSPEGSERSTLAPFSSTFTLLAIDAIFTVCKALSTGKCADEKGLRWGSRPFIVVLNLFARALYLSK